MRTRLTNLERRMEYVLKKTRPIIERKVDAGICVHDIWSLDQFEQWLQLVDSVLEDCAKATANANEAGR